MPLQVLAEARAWVYWWAALSVAISWPKPTFVCDPVDRALKPPPGVPETAALAPTAPMKRSPLWVGVIKGALAGELPVWSKVPAGAWSRPPTPAHSDTLTAYALAAALVRVAVIVLVPEPPLEASPYQISESAVTASSFSTVALVQVTPPPETEDTLIASEVLENTKTSASPAVTLAGRVIRSVFEVTVSDDEFCTAVIDPVPTAAGDCALIEVGPVTLKLVAGADPKRTALAPVKFVPVMVTAVTPAAGPDEGLTALTVGGG